MFFPSAVPDAEDRGYLCSKRHPDKILLVFVLPPYLAATVLLRQRGWACEQDFEAKFQIPEANQKIISVLKYLVGTYELLGGRENEFRKLGTQKSISAIQSLTSPVTQFSSFHIAGGGTGQFFVALMEFPLVCLYRIKDIRGLYGIGSETISKIEEIIETGTCRKAEAFKVTQKSLSKWNGRSLKLSLVFRELFARWIRK